MRDRLAACDVSPPLNVLLPPVWVFFFFISPAVVFLPPPPRLPLCSNDTCTPRSDLMSSPPLEKHLFLVVYASAERNNLVLMHSNVTPALFLRRRSFSGAFKSGVNAQKVWFSLSPTTFPLSVLHQPPSSLEDVAHEHKKQFFFSSERTFAHLQQTSVRLV